MGLAKDKKDLIINHLQNKISKTCPMCNTLVKWEIQGDDLQYLSTFDTEYFQPIAGKIYPIVTAICDNCFFVAQFSAKKIGIV